MFFPGACRAGYGNAEQNADLECRQHHDAAFGKGTGNRILILPPGWEDGLFPAPAGDGRGWPRRAGGGAPPRLCPPDACAANLQIPFVVEPPHPRVECSRSIPSRFLDELPETPCRGRRMAGSSAIAVDRLWFAEAAAAASGTARRHGPAAGTPDGRITLRHARRRGCRRAVRRRAAAAHSRRPTRCPGLGSALSKIEPRPRTATGARAPATRSSASATAKPTSVMAPAAPASRARTIEGELVAKSVSSTPSPFRDSATASSTRNSATATSPRSRATSSPSTSIAPARRRVLDGFVTGCEEPMHARRLRQDEGAWKA